MNRLTETSFDKEIRIGFSKIDRIFDDAISKLDAMKAEYEKKLKPKGSIMTDDIYAMLASIQCEQAGRLSGLLMADQSYNALRQMPMSFDRGQNDMSVAAHWSLGRFGGMMPVYRSPLFGLSDIA